MVAILPIPIKMLDHCFLLVTSEHSNKYIKILAFNKIVCRYFYPNVLQSTMKMKQFLCFGLFCSLISLFFFFFLNMDNFMSCILII